MLGGLYWRQSTIHHEVHRDGGVHDGEEQGQGGGLALEQRIYVYRQRRIRLRADQQCRYLTRARHDLPWIGDLPSQAPQQVLKCLDRAYDNFWNAEHPAGFPRFKNATPRLAIPLPGQAVRVTRLNRKWACVRIPKLGDVKFRLTRPLGGRIKNASIRTDSSGRWYVSFGVHIGRTATPPNGHPPVGVDFGVKQAACRTRRSHGSCPRR